MQNEYTKYLTITLTAFLVALIVLSSVLTFTFLENARYTDTGGTVEVSGEGEVFAKPDLAIITFSVLTEESSADLALEGNSQKTNDVIEALKNYGIEDKDIKTTAFDIRPRYEYHRAETDRPEGSRVLVGYEARQSVETRLREMEKIGEVIESGVSAGANQVNNLVFTIEDEKELKEEARAIAISNAKKEAETLTRQLGVRLGRVLNFNEDLGGIGFMTRSLEMEEVAFDSATTPQIETGENKIEAKVNIVYEIR